MSYKQDSISDTTFTQEELDQTRKYFFYELIPRIQEHVNKTGHIWEKVNICHDCISLRHSYITATNILSITSARADLSAIEIIDLTEQREAYFDTESRKLSD